MKMNYTEAAKERCFSLIDADIDDIWADIENMPEDSDSEKWKKKLIAIASEYTLSSRFALMRIFQRQAVSAREIEAESSIGFCVSFSDGSVGEFKDISMEHAAHMKQDELDLYEKLMMERASRQAGANDRDDLRLVQKALQMHQKKTTLLSKDEALALGHIIDLTLSEMEWFLLRVFNVDGGFRFNSSNDLIDAYVFLRSESHKTGASPEELKKRYCSKYGMVLKTPHDDKSDWTVDNGGSLADNVRKWSADDCDERFMEWMGIRAEHLDLPSLTALRVYRNLAVFAYNLANQMEDAPDVDVLRSKGVYAETDFIRCIREIVSSREYADQTLEALFDGGIISDDKCKTVADALQREMQNMSFSENPDLTKAMHTLDTRNDSSLTINGGISASRTRVHDVLFGKTTIGKDKETKKPLYEDNILIEKSDMLILLWLISNQCWFQGKSNPTSRELITRLFDFIDVAENCLDKAGLPQFYPAHLVEQSMMLSIIYAYAGSEECDPAEVYEQICSSVIEKRARNTNKRKTDEK